MKRPSVLIIGSFVAILLISYGGWVLKRKVNYTFGYQDQVEQTVCEMVKREHLKDPSQCD